MAAVHSFGAPVSFDMARVASRNACVAFRLVAGASRFGREYYRDVTGAFVFLGVASRVGPVAFEVGTVASRGGTVLFFAGRAAPLPGCVTVAPLLDRTASVWEIDLGGQGGYCRDGVAQRVERGCAMCTAGVHTDATARGDAGAFPFFDELIDNDLAVRLRHVVQVIARHVRQSVDVDTGTPHSGRGRVVVALVVPGEDAVGPTSGRVPVDPPWTLPHIHP